ncbi:MAG: hypothetical protein JWN37_25 [Candidatus Nomurabacteria bacterium]|nr:hypothetical protein [Candidatus Nomurabacteria bacterium]
MTYYKIYDIIKVRAISSHSLFNIKEKSRGKDRRNTGSRIFLRGTPLVCPSHSQPNCFPASRNLDHRVLRRDAFGVVLSPYPWCEHLRKCRALRHGNFHGDHAWIHRLCARKRQRMESVIRPFPKDVSGDHGDHSRGLCLQ